jgi:putative flavoprotein involved in K+ transport
MSKTANLPIGRCMQERETLIGSSPRTARRRHGIHLRGRTVEVSGPDVTFSDGATLHPGTVVWATASCSTARGSMRRCSTVTGTSYTTGASPRPPACASLACRGGTRGSALLGWVEDDAAYLARRIGAAARARRARAAPAPSLVARPPPQP